MTNYVGKSCSYCNVSLLETDDIAVCDICERPHHKNCWLGKGGCSTPGCAGNMKNLLPYNSDGDATANNDQPKKAFAFCMHCGNKHPVGDMFCKKCGKSIQTLDVSKDEQNKFEYAQGTKMLAAGDYDKALRLFIKLGSYADSKEQAQICREEKALAEKDRSYLNAVAVLQKQNLSDTDIKEAIDTLKSMSDYKDAKAKISELEKMLEKWYEDKAAAEEAERQRQYESAISCMESGVYDEAIRIFTALGDYSDCKEQLEKAEEASAEARKEQLYTGALAVLTAEHLTEEQIKTAIANLKSISDYKDSEEKIPELEARLEKWYADKAAAIEAEKARIAKEKAKARMRAIIAGAAVFVVAVIIAGVVMLNKNYNLAYNLNGGTVGSSNATSYKMLTDDFTLINPTKEGYTFVGWTGTGLGAPTMSVTIKKGSMGNRSYSANWKANEYTITFDTAGGEMNSESTTVSFGSNVSLPTPTRPGYRFEGWYLGDKLYSDGNWSDTTDLTLTAKWTANSYAITLTDVVKRYPGVVVSFDYNYTDAEVNTVELSNGDVLEYPTNPTRDGYIFAGWYTDSDCTEAYSFSGEITGNMTLYAKWDSLTITDDYYYPWTLSEGALTSTNTSSYSSSEYRITATVAMTVTFDYMISSESYSDCLYIQKNGDTLVNCYDYMYTNSYSVTLEEGDYLSFVYSKGYSYSYSDYACITNLTFQCDFSQESTATVNSSTEGYYEYQFGPEINQQVVFGSSFELPTPTRYGYAFLGWYDGETRVESGVWNLDNSITLTARWEIGTNVITLDANGGSLSDDRIAVTFDEDFTLPTPTREGYTFGGWFCGEKQYVDGTWSEVDDITLVAMWIGNEYNVTLNDAKLKDVVVTLDYNYNSSTSTITLVNGETLTYPTAPTRSDYVFTGWYTDSSCTTRYSFEGEITEDITLYAGWTQMSMSYVYSEYEIDPNLYDSSSNSYYLYMYDTSSSDKYHIYIVAEEAGTHYIYYRSSSSSYYYGYYIQIYNLTTGTTIKSSSSVASTSFNYTSFDCDAGDVIVISTYNYYYYYSSTAYFYFEGFTTPTSNAVAYSDNYVVDEGGAYTTTITCGSEYELPTLSKFGYDFLGWYNGDTKVDSDTWNIVGDVTLTPKWEAHTSNITLDTDGGTVDNSTIDVTYGESYTLPTPTKKGHTFVGWFNNGVQYTDGVWNSEDDITLVAQWTANTYSLTLNDTKKNNVTVTFDKNYTGSTSSTVTLESGEILSYPTEPTRSGYVFTGWYTDSTCTTRYSFRGAIAGDITLYAGWREMSLSYVYDEREINPNVYNSSSNYSTSTSGTSSSYKKHIYVVAEEAGTHYIYYANSTSSSSYKYYLQIYNLTTGTYIRSNSTVSSTYYNYVSFDCNAGDVIVLSLYRYYTSSSYYYSTAYFYFEGFGTTESLAIAENPKYVYDEDSTYSEQTIYGSKLTLPTPSRSGYRFVGWYDGEEKIESGDWSYDRDLSLTPRWEEIVYYNVTFADSVMSLNKIQVTYNYNYSGSTNTVVELNNGDRLYYPTNPTRSGYIFTGWYTNSTCTTKYTFSGTLTENITLYAGWSAISINNSSTYRWSASGSSLTSTNKAHGSTSNYTITATAPMTVSFNYSISSESGWDYLTIYVNGSTVVQVSGSQSGEYSRTLNTGDTITFTYKKDGSGSSGSDTAYITNLTFTSTEYMTSTAVAECNEVSGVEYRAGSSFVESVGLGEYYTLPVATREGYTFLGWYHGESKVESGVWIAASDITLTPRWE